MIWRSVVSVAAIGALGLFALSAGHGQEGQPKQKGQGQPKQQQAAPGPQKSMKEALVGSWSLLISDYVNPDGTQTPQWGPNPMGVLMFDSTGHYSTTIMRASLPKIAANDRTKGTTDENKAIMQGMLTHFGSYTLDEPSRTLTFRIEGSSYTNWAGTVQKRMITALNPDDVLTYTVAMPAAGTLPVTLAWKYMK